MLRSLWTEPRPQSAPSPGRSDYALVAAFALAVLIETAARPDLAWRAPTAAIALALLPTLLIRRNRPLLGVAIGFGATAVAAPIIGGEPRLGSMIFLLFLPYALYRWGSGREIVLGTAVVLVKIATSLPLADFGLTEAGSGIAVLTATVAVGAAFRYRASARSRELAQVRLTERERLARDLHDTVAHHVSAIAIRAQAGIAVADVEPGAAVDALRLIETEASRTLTELRSIVRVLRSDDPVPLLADVAALADDSHPPVDVRITGATDTIGETVATTLYRLAQESVTNARRHARSATRIEVRVVVDPESVRLRVHDDGAPAPNPAPGYGLRGMIERADLLGGRCDAGPDPERGWTVTAELPRA